ncbi:hypothetical protein L208DRAFT_1269226, partial [Tricholoma matsutake]
SKWITFNFLDSSHIEHISQHPPCIHSVTYYPNHPHFVLPIYGLEVAIPNVSSFSTVLSDIDSYIQTSYSNDAICHSRLVFDGDIYCVVLKDWP